MDYDEFVGQVKYRIHVPSSEEAEQSIRATLETLAGRLSGGTVENLAAQLPREIGEPLRREAVGDLNGGKGFDLNEFYQRVAARARIPFLDAAIHTRAVLDVLQRAVPPREIENIRAQLPKDYVPLFQSWSTSSAARQQGRDNERRPGASS